MPVRKDIKQQILEAARTQFAANGYNAVSMRAIADAVGISVGNLTYHFRRKEDLAEAVLAQQMENYKKPEPATTLVDLNDFFMRILNQQEEGDDFWSGVGKLAEASPAVMEMRQRQLMDLKEALEETFRNLRNAGLIKRDAFPDQTPCLVEIMMALCVNGTVIGEMDRLKCLWSLIYPILR